MKKQLIVAAACAGALVLGGCSGGTASTQSASSDSSASASSASATAAESSSAEATATTSSSASSAASSNSSETPATSSSSSASQSSSSSETGGNTLPKESAEQLIEGNGYGDVTSIEQVKIDGVWYWQASVTASDGSKHTYNVDSKGTVTSADKNSESSNSTGNSVTKNKLSKSEVEKIIWQNGLGSVDSMKKVTLADNVEYWQVVTRSADNSKSTFMINPDGAVSEK